MKKSLESLRNLVDAIKNNTYNLSDENEKLILLMLESELSNINCSPSKTCEFSKTISETNLGVYEVKCEYLDKVLNKTIYDKEESDYMWGCPYLELLKKVRALKLRK